MDHMDWIILKTIFETKNITKAAKNLFMSQPALTYRLQNLEKQFGKPLFYMEKKQLYFTDTGTLLIQHAKDMLIKEQEIKDLIAISDNAHGGTVRLGTTDTYAHFRVAPLLNQFIHSFPGITILLKTGSSQDILDMLNNGEIHVGICNIGGGYADEKRQISRDRLTIVTKEPVNLTSLPYIPMIKYKQNTILKGMLDNWWSENYTIPPLINIEVKTVETAMSMVDNGLGYCIVPEMTIHLDSPLHTTHLRDRKQQYLSRPCWLRYHSKVLEITAVRNFVDFLLKYHYSVQKSI